MPGWLRVLLILFGIFILICVTAGVFGYVWFKNHKAELMEGIQHVDAEAKAFAEGKEGTVCLDEGLRRASTDYSFKGQMKARLFTKACLRHTKDNSKLCSNVPTGIIAMATWSATECEKRGMAGNQTCTGILQEVAQECSRPK